MIVEERGKSKRGVLMDDLKTREQDLIKRTIRKENQAMLNNDQAILKEVIAPDAVMEHITGAKQTRDEWLRQISLGRMKYYSSREDGLTVVMKNTNHATVDLRAVLDARVYGFRNKWRLESISKLIKKDNHWQIVASTAKMY